MNDHGEFCDYDNCDDAENEEQKVLMLTRDEAFYIDDHLTMMIEQQDKLGNFATVRPLANTAGLPAPVDLLDKIAMAVLQTTGPDTLWEAEAKIFVTATDLYMLREVAKSKGETGATVTSELIMTLALQYGVEYSTIRNVIVGKTWKNGD